MVASFVDQTAGILWADAKHLDCRRLARPGVVIEGKAHLVVFVEPQIILAEKVPQFEAFRRVERSNAKTDLGVDTKLCADFHIGLGLQFRISEQLLHGWL